MIGNVSRLKAVIRSCKRVPCDKHSRDCLSRGQRQQPVIVLGMRQLRIVVVVQLLLCCMWFERLPVSVCLAKLSLLVASYLSVLPLAAAQQQQLKELC